jgi:hypothetical protein
MRPGRLLRSAIVVKPSTLLRLHRTLTQRKYRRLFSSKESMKPGPKGPSHEVMAAVGRRSGESPSVSVAAALSGAVLHAEGRVTQSIRNAFTAAVFDSPLTPLS